MLIGKNIFKSYGDLRVLNGVDITVEQGEIVSIVGASGAGKSTLLHILGTLDRVDQGELIFDNEPIHNLKRNALATFRNQNLGFVFQFHHLLPEFTAMENVAIPAMMQGKSIKECSGRAEQLLGELGLSDRVTHKPGELSGGEQQRVAVARALMNEPKIIFADEPSGNLDSQSSEQLHQLLLDIRNRFNSSFIIVTHNAVLANLADRTLTMEDGKIRNE